MIENDFLKDLRETADCVLSVRDDIGAQKAEINIIRRWWTGEAVGDGEIGEETCTPVYPSPHLVDYSHSLRLQTGGNWKAGDLLLKSLSMERYTVEYLEGRGLAKNEEQFFEIDGKLYRVISSKVKYATIDVQVRRLTDQRR